MISIMFKPVLYFKQSKQQVRAQERWSSKSFSDFSDKYRFINVILIFLLVTLIFTYLEMIFLQQWNKLLDVVDSGRDERSFRTIAHLL